MSSEMKKQLPEKEELLQLIIDSCRDFAIFATDPEGLVTTWNVGAERLFGFAETEVLGRSADFVFTAADREAGMPEQERLRARSQGRALDERWHQRKDGSLFWASGLLMPLNDPGLGFVKIARDLTEQHQANQRLREQEERFRLLATSIPQMVFLTRPNGDRTWGSPQWIAFTGLSLPESLGFGWLSAIHPDDIEQTQSAWADAQRRGEYYVEHRVRSSRNGEYRWHQTRARPINGSSPGAGDWVGTMTDIQHLRGLQDRQQVLMAELQHRTRNLLAVVQSIASRTARSSTSLEAFRAEFESRLQALSRVQSLLARAEDRGIDLHSLVTAELAAYGDTGLPSGKIQVAGAAVTLPPMAAQAIGLALHELATNAVKYGALAQPAGRLVVRWEFQQEGFDPWVSIQWQESGVLLPPITGASQRRGYGRELIERALPYQMRAKTSLSFGPEGVHCEIRVPVADKEEAHG